jgi:hypothetical protein
LNFASPCATARMVRLLEFTNSTPQCTIDSIIRGPWATPADHLQMLVCPSTGSTGRFFIVDEDSHSEHPQLIAVPRAPFSPVRTRTVHHDLIIPIIP